MSLFSARSRAPALPVYDISAYPWVHLGLSFGPAPWRDSAGRRIGQSRLKSNKESSSSPRAGHRTMYGNIILAGWHHTRSPSTRTAIAANGTAASGNDAPRWQLVDDLMLRFQVSMYALVCDQRARRFFPRRPSMIA